MSVSRLMLLLVCSCVTALTWHHTCNSTAASPGGPTLQDCVLLEHANATCTWRPLGHDPPGTNYTLHLDEMTHLGGRVFYSRSCWSLSTRCSVPINTASADYCVQVEALRPDGPSGSAYCCFQGIQSVKLYPPIISRVSAVTQRPNCLQLLWSQPQSFALGDSEVSAGLLVSQLQYWREEEDGGRPQGSRLSQVDLSVREHCLFSPHTLYGLRIQYRYAHAHHWSEWSNVGRARTAQEAPSQPPKVWRFVESSGADGWRRVTLTWKASGMNVSYSASCWCDSVLMDSQGCVSLSPPNVSCSLYVSKRSCSCCLTAFTVAGASPPGCVSVPDPAHSHTGLPPPSSFSVHPLDDVQLEARWTAPVGQSASGFVLEWFAVYDTGLRAVDWEKVDGNVNTLVISGLLSQVRYTVSVVALYELDAGEKLEVDVYSSQGAPSTGPILRVTELYASSVLLQWQPLSVEQQRGFIRSYTLHWQESQEANGSCLVIPANTHQYLLTGLWGEYKLYLVASNDAGHRDGPTITVVVGHGSTYRVPILLCSVTVSLITALVLLACICFDKRMKLKYNLCMDVPNPKWSSVSVWKPNSEYEGLDAAGTPLGVQPFLLDTQECETFSTALVVPLGEPKPPSVPPVSDALHLSYVTTQGYVCRDEDYAHVCTSVCASVCGACSHLSDVKAFPLLLRLVTHQRQPGTHATHLP